VTTILQEARHTFAAPR